MPYVGELVDVKLACRFCMFPGGDELLPPYNDGGGARAEGGIANAVSNWSMIGVGFHCMSDAEVGCW